MGQLLVALSIVFAGPADAAAAARRVSLGELRFEGNEYNYSESADGQLRMFARSNHDFSGARIYVSHRQGVAWNEPTLVSFSDPRYKDSDPFLSRDGRTLYFISDRPTASRPDKKDLDIWRSAWVDGEWQAPEHLGDVLNSVGEELGPELHGDTLYFNSTRPGGPGKLSIYRSQLIKGKFQAPVPLPAPINSASVQGDFTISPDGRLALFWSQRPHEGHGTLFAAEVTANGWAEPYVLSAEVNLSDSPFLYTPWFSHDGEHLYFAAMIKDGEGKSATSRIYRVSRQALARP